MKRHSLKLTRSESHWVSVFSFLTLVITALFFVRPLLPDIAVRHEPLADPASLKLLVGGKSLPVPTDEAQSIFLGESVPVPPLASIVGRGTERGILGATTGEKRIEVDLTNQKVYAFEGTQKVYEFTVSTGKWAPTPTGEFTIWTKVKSQKMSGGTPGTGTYYYLPNVPWVMFFSNNEVARERGFSLHGTYWHNNFGHPMSHGCINMRIEDAGTLFAWATPIVTNDSSWSTNAAPDNPGTKVVIYGVTPNE